MLSVFDMFKIGIGPSSSHTLGPMKAGKMFIDEVLDSGRLGELTRITINLYGSLALTGKGHQTDQAILLGLSGEEPETVVIENIPRFMKAIAQDKKLFLADKAHSVKFFQDLDITFNIQELPLHENGMIIRAFAGNETVAQKTYYSIGGGVIREEKDFGKEDADEHAFPYPFRHACDILQHCNATGMSISALVLENELSLRTNEEITALCRKIWNVMSECVKRGVQTEGLLPGHLRVPRRAPGLRRILTTKVDDRNPLIVMDWVNMFALAVSEENAAGGRVVTAPTNGSCGIVPAVLCYYNKFIEAVDDEVLSRYFLTSGAIGLLYRMNASISGAEVGCQGEVGVATSMAAAGLAELCGASPEQVCTAAEIGMEHNLGLTCDPIGGLVQIPCIERNAINAIKAINASRMALERRSNPAVNLDTVIEAMFSTGKDMNPKYRETAQGGLATAKTTSCG